MTTVVLILAYMKLILQTLLTEAGKLHGSMQTVFNYFHSLSELQLYLQILTLYFLIAVTMNLAVGAV